MKYETMHVCLLMLPKNPSFPSIFLEWEGPIKNG